MKRIWGLTLCAILATLLYAGVLFILKINPLTDLKRFFIGSNFNFLSLLSPFLFITTLYYILYFANIFFAPKKIKVSKSNQLVSKNTLEKEKTENKHPLRQQKSKSVLGKIHQLETLHEIDNSEISSNNQKQQLTNNHKRDNSNNSTNEIDQKTKALEDQLNNNYNNKAKIENNFPNEGLNIDQDTKKSKPVVITLLKDDISAEPHPLFLNDLSANFDNSDNKGYSLNKENDFKKVREELEHEEKYSLEIVNLENNHLVSDVDALAVAEGLEEGNALFTQPEKSKDKTSVASVLDNLLRMEGLDEILSNEN